VWFVWGIRREEAILLERQERTSSVYCTHRGRRRLSREAEDHHHPSLIDRSRPDQKISGQSTQRQDARCFAMHSCPGPAAVCVKSIEYHPHPPQGYKEEAMEFLVGCCCVRLKNVWVGSVSPRRTPPKRALRRRQWCEFKLTSKSSTSSSSSPCSCVVRERASFFDATPTHTRSLSPGVRWASGRSSSYGDRLMALAPTPLALTTYCAGFWVPDDAAEHAWPRPSCEEENERRRGPRLATLTWSCACVWTHAKLARRLTHPIFHSSLQQDSEPAASPAC
jgi:hypothetical protein